MSTQPANKSKQTEIGKIPADWVAKRLEDEIEFTRGISWGKADESRGGVPVIGIPNVQRNGINYEIKYRIKKKISDEKRLRSGDILLVGSSGSVKNVGRLAQVTNPPYEILAFASFLVKAAPKTTNIKREYLSFVLQGPSVNFQECSRKAADGKFNLQIEELKKQSLLLPPKLEQEKIAVVLSKIQKAVAHQEKIVADLRELKAAIIAKLLREGLRGEPLKQTEIGEVPVGWQIKALTACCEKPQYGYTESSSESPIGPKFLRITDLTQNGVDWGTVPYCKCSESDFIKHQLKAGDILVARIGATTGKNHLIVDCPKAVFASYLIRLRAMPGLVPEFLSNFMDSDIYWKQVRATKGQNLKGGMSGAVLSQILMPFPSEPEQKEISNAIAIIDRSIRYAVEKHFYAKVLFSSTLNQLMMGKVRV